MAKKIVAGRVADRGRSTACGDPDTPGQRDRIHEAALDLLEWRFKIIVGGPLGPPAAGGPEGPPYERPRDVAIAEPRRNCFVRPLCSACV